ncbi:MAG TPA: asparaginase, partial [Gemmatimonadaceae bacterium]|nr:asparaginase [Gemmatimonadaceae bacterium]
MSLNLDVVVTRGTVPESRHRVHAAVVDAAGVLRASAGDPATVTVWRSCAKPFQTMPFVESGGLDTLQWGERELAIACASHGGEPEHVTLVQRMLDSLGLEEDDLACGAHDPLSKRGSRLLREADARPTRLHNNCSGKHTAMLALARTQGWPTSGYEREAHPIQQGALACVSRWTGVPAERIERCVDGCGVVAFALPLDAMALGFVALAEAARCGEEVPGRIVRAMTTHPFLVGGTDRFDTVLMEETAGAILSKVGAEGVHTVAVRDESIAFA